MKWPFFRRSKTLFVTKSGIQVKQVLPVLPKEHFLVRFNKSRQAMLDGRPITETQFRQLLQIIQHYHPDAWSHFEAHQSIIIYPKLVVED